MHHDHLDCHNRQLVLRYSIHRDHQLVRQQIYDFHGMHHYEPDWPCRLSFQWRGNHQCHPIWFFSVPLVMSVYQWVERKKKFNKLPPTFMVHTIDIKSHFNYHVLWCVKCNKQIFFFFFIHLLNINKQIWCRTQKYVNISFQYFDNPYAHQRWCIIRSVKYQFIQILLIR